MCLNLKIRIFLFLRLIKTSNFHPLEVVGSGRETELQVAEI